MVGLSRNLAPKISYLLKQFPVVALIGARQCGKTTLAKQVAPDWYYLDLENGDDFDRVMRDPTFFFEQHPDSVIIDEAQESDELFRFLRGVIDKKRERKGRFLLTGSSSPDLLGKISESLAGRIAIVEVGPFKANEFYKKDLSELYSAISDDLKVKVVEGLSPQMTVQQMRRFWLFGGYPEPILQNDLQVWKTWMENYRATYINRDIRKLFPRLDILKYRRFINMLGRLSGTIINRAEVAGAIEVSEPTVKDYIQIADGTFIWRNLPSLERDISKAIIKMPKGHLRDSGLLHFILKLTDLDDLESDPIVGRSFEVFVIEEIVKGLQATLATNWTPHYYRTKNRAEIDLVIDGEFGLLPIEIKYGTKVHGNDLRTIKSFVDEHKLKLGIVINCSEKVELLAPKIIQVPVGCI